MSSRLLALFAATVLAAGCATPAPHSTHTDTAEPQASTAVIHATAAAHDNLNALAWTQTAIEHDLIYLQTYRDAQARLLQALADPHWDALGQADRITPVADLPPAVILDIDETVLDNSPYQARLLKSGGEFNAADWADWCREERARALPGAVAFTQFAARHGITVIYISNRPRALDQATLANLRKAGFPDSGPDALLGLGVTRKGCTQTGTEKGCRRQLVSERYRVLMQFGDQVGDFVDISHNTDAGRREAVAAYLPWIGTRWFVLPNPTYGSWEAALFNNNWKEPRELRRQQKIDALRNH
ncbi:MAG: HAD family acid phosphatase [Rhodanobacter sp.]